MYRFLLVILLCVSYTQALHAKDREEKNLEETYCENKYRRYDIIPGQYRIVFKPGARLKNLSTSDLKLAARLQKMHLTEILQRYLRTKKIKLDKACYDLEELEKELQLVKRRKLQDFIELYEKRLKDFKEEETEKLLSNTTSLVYYLEYNYRPLDDEEDAYDISREECLQEMNFIRHLMQHPLIESVEPEEFNRLTSEITPNDPLLFEQSTLGSDRTYPLLWSLEGMNASTAWNYSRGREITVAVIDSGVDKHPDITANLLPGKDVLDNDDVPNDKNGHGTHIAGIIAAVGNNQKGIAGLAYESKILPIRIFDSKGRLPTKKSCKLVKDALAFAITHNASVLNCSFSLKKDDQEVKVVFENTAKTKVIIAAAGNDGVSTETYPAAYSGVVSVASINSLGAISDFSNIGDWVDITAPGENILSLKRNRSRSAKKSPRALHVADENDKYGYWLDSGTSFAAPHVSAVAALMLSYDPSLSPTQIQEYIIANSSYAILSVIPYDIGIVDAGEVLSVLFSKKALDLTEHDEPDHFLSYDEKVDYASAINKALILNDLQFDVNNDGAMDNSDDELLNEYIHSRGLYDLPQINRYRTVITFIDKDGNGVVDVFERLEAQAMLSTKPFTADVDQDGHVTYPDYLTFQTVLEYLD